MTATLTKAEIRELMDVEVFARRVVGEPLWDYQLQVARSRARFRTMCAGRQVGKSRTLAIICLHRAFTVANSRVLVISTTEENARDLMRTISVLASGPWLGASVEQDDSTKVVFSNGSEIRCIPASHRRARGASIDLLVLDEAAHIDEDVWNAAKYSILARPDAQVVMASTPKPGRDRFFARYWQMGMDGREGYESWHWPSSISPIVSQALIEEWRQTEPPRVFDQEVLAKFVDSAGAYFSVEEIDAATADYELESPEDAARDDGWRPQLVGGIDWGFSSDANSLVVLGPLDDRLLNDRRLGFGRLLHVRWVEARSHWRYSEFVQYLVKAAHAFQLQYLASETTGVGVAPTQDLWAHLRNRVVPVHTDNARKETGFGALKVLLAQQQIVIPRRSVLRSQLLALEFEMTPSGNMRIAVPERGGQHDDAAMALLQALSAVDLTALQDRAHTPGEDPSTRLFGGDHAEYWNARALALQGVESGELPIVETGGGLRIPARPGLPIDAGRWTQFPKGKEKDKEHRW
jgi:hypothetical protein